MGWNHTNSGRLRLDQRQGAFPFLFPFSRLIKSQKTPTSHNQLVLGQRSKFGKVMILELASGTTEPRSPPATPPSPALFPLLPPSPRGSGLLRTVVWRNLRGFSRCNSILFFLLLCAQPSIVVSLKDISLLTGTTFMSLCILFVFRGRAACIFPFSRLSFATFPSRISGYMFSCSWSW